MATEAAMEPSPISEQKKRAFDALERRFTLARAEILHEEQRKKRKEATNREQGGKGLNVDEKLSAITTPSTPKIYPSSSMKGNANISGKTSGKYSSFAADTHPAYSPLLEGINEKLINVESTVTNRGDIVNKIIYDLLQHGDQGNKFKRTSLKKKLDHCILLDNFVHNDGVSVVARAKALQSHSKRSKKHMSLKQHRNCGSFDMPEEFHRFDLFKPMHDMWKDYILELIKESRKKQLAQCLLTADLHGAYLAVVDCKTTSFIGVSGIMIRETAETFGIIKQDNKFRVIPKRGSVFMFQAGCWKITLHGDKLSMRYI